jgi:hypothetical protein
MPSLQDCLPCLTGELAYIQDPNCPTFWKGISRLIFQDENAAPISYADTQNDLADPAFMAALLDQANTTVDKMVITPRNSLVGLAITPPEPVTTTDTTDGSEIILGTTAKPQLAGMVKNLSPAQYLAFMQMNCRNAKFFVVNVAGQVWGRKIDGVEQMTGFSIKPSTFYLSGLQHDGSPLAQSDFPLRMAFDRLDWYANAVKQENDFLESYIAA